MATLNIRIEGLEAGESWELDLEFYRILKSYVQPGDAASAQATAEQLHELRPDVRPEADDTSTDERETLEVFSQSFWIMFAEIAREIPYDHPSQQRMLDLALALRELKSPQGVGWYGPGYALHEWIRITPFDPRSTDPEAEANKLRTANLYAFAARLTAIRYDDYAYVAIWAMTEALEEMPDPRAKAWHTQGPVLDAWVPIAAQWIRIAGDVVLQKCRDEVEANGAPFPNNKRGRKGFFMDRWRFWRDGLDRVSGMVQAGEATREIAAKTRERMVELENGGGSSSGSGGGGGGGGAMEKED